MRGFLAGDTPELLLLGMLEAALSPQALRGVFHSSELATREPDPVFASVRSCDAPAKVLLSLALELLSLAVGKLPRPLMGLVLPHMLLAQGFGCEERSESALFSDIPPL